MLLVVVLFCSWRNFVWQYGLWPSQVPACSRRKSLPWLWYKAREYKGQSGSANLPVCVQNLFHRDIEFSRLWLSAITWVSNSFSAPSRPLPLPVLGRMMREWLEGTTAMKQSFLKELLVVPHCRMDFNFLNQVYHYIRRPQPPIGPHIHGWHTRTGHQVHLRFNCSLHSHLLESHLGLIGWNFSHKENQCGKLPCRTWSVNWKGGGSFVGFEQVLKDIWARIVALPGA